MESARSSSVETASMGGAVAGGGLLVRSYSSAGSSSGGGVRARVVRLRTKAREHRARFYVGLRCLHILLCWRDDT